MRRWVTVAVALGGVVMACGGGAQALPETKSPEQITDEHKARMEAVHAKYTAMIYWPKCEAPPRPGRDCGLVTRSALTDANVARFIVNECHESADDPVSPRCKEAFWSHVLKLLVARYELAKPDEVGRACDSAPSECETLILIELKFLVAHNAAVQAAEDRELGAIVQSHAEEQRRTAEQRRIAAEAAERERRAWAGVAAGLSAAGQGLTAAARQQQEVTVPTCTSDYQCGYGNLCAKAQGAMEGTCARAVNQFGNPTFQGPRPGSVGPGDGGNCGFDTDCPIGFKCIKGNAIRGNCMK